MGSNYIKSEAEEINLFSCCTVYDHKILAPLSMVNILVEIDVTNKKTKYLTCIEGVEYKKMEAFGFCIANNHNLYLVENNGKRMLEYELDKNKFKYINLDCDSKNWGNFCGMIFYQSKIYLFPRLIDEIIEFDTESGLISKNTILCNFIKNNYQPDSIYFSCSIQIDNIMWLFMEKAGVIVKYDLDHQQFVDFQFSQLHKGIQCAAYFDKELFILSADCNLYKFNCYDNILHQVTVNNYGFSRTDLNFSRIIVTGKNIWLLPGLGKNIYIYDFDDKGLVLFNNYPEDFKLLGHDWTSYSGICEMDNTYYVGKRRANYILAINKITGKEEWIYPVLPNKKDEFDIYKNNREILLEEDGLFSFFLDQIDQENNKSEKEYIPAGNKIWNIIKES